MRNSDLQRSSVKVFVYSIGYETPSIMPMCYQTNIFFFFVTVWLFHPSDVVSNHFDTQKIGKKFINHYLDCSKKIVNTFLKIELHKILLFHIIDIKY